MTKKLVAYGIDSGDWSNGLSAGSGLSELQQLCKAILEAKWRKRTSEEMKGTIAGKILHLWDAGYEGKKLWEAIAEELKYNEGGNKMQPDDPNPMLEPGMRVRTLKELKLHPTEMHKKQQGTRKGNCGLLKMCL